MSKRLITTRPDLRSRVEWCANCHQFYTPLEYYRGSIVSQRGYKADANTTCRETVYRNVAMHIGGLCRWCVKENRKRAARIFSIVGAAGLLACVGGILLGVLLPAETKQSLLPLWLSLCLAGGLSVLIGGIYVLRTACMKPGSDTNYSKAYDMFLRESLRNKQIPNGIGYLSKYQAKRLKTR